MKWEGFHHDPHGRSFEVFGDGDRWFWWYREPFKSPDGKSRGPFFVPQSAHEAAYEGKEA